MVEIAHYQTRAEAEMVKGFLENAGIAAHVSIDDEGGLLPALGAQKGAKVLVSDNDTEEAKKILEKIDKPEE